MKGAEAPPSTAKDSKGFRAVAATHSGVLALWKFCMSERVPVLLTQEH